MSLRLLCDRPLFRRLDVQSTRFVVSKVCGVDVGGKHLEFGEEVPRGALTPYALGCLYDRPLSRIDALEYALTIDGLREACLAHGVQPEAPPAEQVVKPDLDSLDYQGLLRLCELYQLERTGNTRQLRRRLEKFLG